MQDNSNDSTVQTIQCMEGSLQDLTPAMIKMGDTIERLGQRIQNVGTVLRDFFADISLQFKALSRQHAQIVVMMKDHLPKSSNLPVLPVQSKSVPKKSNAHMPLQHIRAASNPSLLELKDENKQSFHSSATATFEVILDHKTEVEKRSVNEAINKMAQFRKMWSNQSIPIEEKIRFKKKYDQQVSQAYLSKDISKENKHKILKIRMELIALKNYDLIATLKSNSRRLIKKE